MCDALKCHKIIEKSSPRDANLVFVREAAMLKMLMSTCVDQLFDVFPSFAVGVACVAHQVKSVKF